MDNSTVLIKYEQNGLVPSCASGREDQELVYPQQILSSLVTCYGKEGKVHSGHFVTFHLQQPLLFHDLVSTGNPVRASDGLKRSP